MSHKSYFINLKSILSLFLILYSLFFFTQSAKADITTGLVGHWNLDEGSGTTAADSSGNNNTGTLTNGPTWTAGKIGSNAVSFDGVDDYVTMGDIASIDTATSLSSCTWVNHSSITDDDTIMNKADGISNGFVFLRDDVASVSGRTDVYVIYIEESDGTSNVRIEGATNSSPLNQWTHVCFTYTKDNATGLHLYVNGVEDANSPVSTVGILGINAGLKALEIGRRSNGVYFNGSIDEVRIYNRALSASDITELYNSTGLDTTPPVLSAGSPSGSLPSGTTQTILSVTTDESATCKYGTIAGVAYGSISNNFSTTGETSHSSTITGLTEGTSYNYYIRCQDGSGNTNTSDYTISFSISTAPDITPPVITNIQSSFITQIGATITWTTDEASDSQIEYGLTTSYGSQTTLDTLLVTSHSQTLTGLTASTLYHYRVKSKDAAGNLQTSGDNTFGTTIPVGSIWYVSPIGSPFGNGSIDSPWNLQTAFNHPSVVKPGDTIYLRGGTYTGVFTSKLNGTISSPITVRSYPGEWAKIDGANNTEADVINVNGTNTWYMEFEILRSGFQRSFNRSGCGINLGGIDFNKGNNKLINTIIHDTSVGASAFSDAPNTEIYGNVIYYNGWFELIGKQRPCDHGFYGQNETGVKEIKDNIIFQNFAIGITPHGTAVTYLNNFDIEGNTLFQSGEIANDPDNPGRNFWWSNLGGAVAQSPRIVSNFMYYSDVHLPGAGSFFLLSPSSNAVIQNNYMMRGDLYITGQTGTINLNFSGNHIWGSLTGFNPNEQLNNTYYDEKPTNNSTIVRPNKYDSNRANITIYNWQNQNSVTVDISSLGWVPGTTYELRNVQNYFQDLIIGTYDGTGSISVPMAGHTVAQPIGISAPVSTFPEFGAFVLIRTGAPPILSGGSPSGVLSSDTTQITLQVTTDKNATCKYGTTANTAFSSIADTFGTTGGTSHSQTIMRLTNGQAYTYYVRCQDSTGNANTKDYIISFSVTAGSSFFGSSFIDTIPPIVSVTAPLSGETVSGFTTVSATASDNVGITAVQFFLDGTILNSEDVSSPYSIIWNTASSTNELHSIVAVAKDVSNNKATSTNIVVTVANAPIISNIQVTNIDQDSVTITWTTNKPSTSKVNYGLSAKYIFSTISDSSLTTYHSVSIGNLKNLTTYHFQIESTEGGVTAVSGDDTFVTSTPPPIPLISNIQPSNITQDSAAISWTTDIPSNSQIEYGLTTSYGLETTFDPTPITSHSQTLSNLSPGSTYHYRLKSNGAVSVDRIFATQIGSLDLISPAAINNFTADKIYNTSVDLSWTVPGDDNNIGTALSYLIRWSFSPITAQNWSSAGDFIGIPAPQKAGTRQIYTAIGLLPNTTYYIAISTLDEAGNISPLSNVLTVTTKRNPPNTIKNLKVTTNSSSITFNWTIPDFAHRDIKYAILRTAVGGVTAYNVNTQNVLVAEDLSTPFFTDMNRLPNTLYNYSIFGYYDNGIYGQGMPINTTTLSTLSLAPIISIYPGGGGGNGGYIDSVSPLKPKLLRAVEADSQVFVEWENSKDSDFARILVIKNSQKPNSSTDGSKVFEHFATSTAVINLINDSRYYFAISSIDRNNNLSSPLIFEAIPKPGVLSFAEKFIKKDIASSTAYIEPVIAPVVGSGKLTLIFKKPLFLGIKNQDVKNLQEFLSEDKEIYPEGLVTGFFGKLTEKAVQRFQIKHNIVTQGTPETTGFGRVGPKTIAKLNEIFGMGDEESKIEETTFSKPAPIPEIQQPKEPIITSEERQKLTEEIQQQIQNLQRQLWDAQVKYLKEKLEI